MKENSRAAAGTRILHGPLAEILFRSVQMVYIIKENGRIFAPFIPPRVGPDPCNNRCNRSRAHQSAIPCEAHVYRTEKCSQLTEAVETLASDSAFCTGQGVHRLHGQGQQV